MADAVRHLDGHNSFMAALTLRTNSALLGGPGAGRTLALPACLVAAGLGAVAAWSTFSGDRRVGVAAVSLLVFGLFQLVCAFGVLYRRRQRADDWLRTATGDVVPPAYAWRARQLTSSYERRMLARTIRLVAQRACERSVGRYRPRLIAARKRRVALEALAKTLERETEPVTPAGMLRVVDLVTAGGGPLWGANEEELGEAIEATLAVLAPREASS
jgi:hypothetical protein